MQDDFILTVDYKGAAQDYVANLILQGYTHKIRVLISGQEIFFEPDEEGDYRAITLPGQEDKALQKIDRHFCRFCRKRLPMYYNDPPVVLFLPNAVPADMPPIIHKGQVRKHILQFRNLALKAA